MRNPYESPKNGGKKPPLDAASLHPVRDLPRFFAWYFGAFIVATLLWHLSAFVKRVDFLEVPMASVCFPIAGFLDPHDGMVNDRNTVIYGAAFWAAVIPMSLYLTPRRINPLTTAFAMIGICSSASVVYSVLVVWTSNMAVIGPC